MKYDIASSYNIKKYPWYSPHIVISAMSSLTKKYGANVETKGEFKLAREMFDAAVSLLGAYELHTDNKYFMQPNLQSGSPDVVAVKQTEITGEPFLLEKTNIEIVTMNDYSDTEDVVEFLQKTKLSSKKSYDSYTLIVCVINKKIQINRQKIIERLKEIKPKSTVYILGKLQNESDKWTIFSPFPVSIRPVIYSFSTTMQKYSLPHVVTLHRGSTQKITYEKGEQSKISIYEIFNLNEEKLEKYRKV